LDVPEVLRNGDHARIARWRRDRALLLTAARRPDLLDALAPGTLDPRDIAVLSGAGFQVPGPDVAE
jgi:tRNA (guanine37-N1)-methyltransferase